MAFPTALDDFTDYIDGTTIMEAATLNNMQHAIEFIEVKIGIDGSAVSASHDYKLANLTVGSDVQAYDVDLAAISGLTSAADRIIHYTGSGTAELLDSTTFVRTTGTQSVGGAKTFTTACTLQNSSQMSSSAAPTSDADIANKKYIDDQIAAYIASKVTLSAYTIQDSESDTMLESHAYLAATDGVVYAVNVDLDNGEAISVFVGTTNNPSGAGSLIQIQESAATATAMSVTAKVAKDEYFEIIDSGTGAAPIILWKSMGTLSKPIDQD